MSISSNSTEITKHYIPQHDDIFYIVGSDESLGLGTTLKVKKFTKRLQFQQKDLLDKISSECAFVFPKLNSQLLVHTKWDKNPAMGIRMILQHNNEELRIHELWSIRLNNTAWDEEFSQLRRSVSALEAKGNQTKEVKAEKHDVRTHPISNSSTSAMQQSQAKERDAKAKTTEITPQPVDGVSQTTASSQTYANESDAKTQNLLITESKLKDMTPTAKTTVNKNALQQMNDKEADAKTKSVSPITSQNGNHELDNVFNLLMSRLISQNETQQNLITALTNKVETLEKEIAAIKASSTSVSTKEVNFDSPHLNEYFQFFTYVFDTGLTALKLISEKWLKSNNRSIPDTALQMLSQATSSIPGVGTGVGCAASTFSTCEDRNERGGATEVITKLGTIDIQKVKLWAAGITNARKEKIFQCVNNSDSSDSSQHIGSVSCCGPNDCSAIKNASAKMQADPANTAIKRLARDDVKKIIDELKKGNASLNQNSTVAELLIVLDKK